MAVGPPAAVRRRGWSAIAASGEGRHRTVVTLRRPAIGRARSGPGSRLGPDFRKSVRGRNQGLNGAGEPPPSATARRAPGRIPRWPDAAPPRPPQRVQPAHRHRIERHLHHPGGQRPASQPRDERPPPSPAATRATRVGFSSAWWTMSGSCPAVRSVRSSQSWQTRPGGWQIHRSPPSSLVVLTRKSAMAALRIRARGSQSGTTGRVLGKSVSRPGTGASGAAGRRRRRCRPWSGGAHGPDTPLPRPLAGGAGQRPGQRVCSVNLRAVSARTSWPSRAHRTSLNSSTSMAPV